MSRSNQREDPLSGLFEFALAGSEIPVPLFYQHLYRVYSYNEGLKRAEAYYVSELRILKEPSKKLKTCHEYVVAVIRRTDGKEEIHYLAFERSIGKQPQTEDDPHPPHPNRALERRLFLDREVPMSDNEDNQEMARLRPSLGQRAMASTTSLDSIRKKAILADDRVLLLKGPYQKKDDIQVAILRLQPPPDAVILPESTSPSTSSTPWIRLRKLSDPHREPPQNLHRTTSGPSAISYAPRDASHTDPSTTTPSLDESSSTPGPAPTSAASKPIKRKWIYLYELAIIAYKLSVSKSLYHLWSKNCYWFAGMLIHVVRMFTDNTLELRESNRVGHVQPDEDMLSWYDKQMGKWMNVIRVVKTPMNYTVEVLVEEFWAERQDFEKRVVKQRLDHTKSVRERERKRNEEELQRVRDEERKRNEEELRRVRDEERKRNEEEMQRVREDERKRNEELQRVREDEKKRNEELQRVRNEQERDKKAREEAEQKMKLLMEHLQAGRTPPPELLAQIAKTPKV